MVEENASVEPDFKKVNLAFDCEGVPMLLQRPHITERVELLSPITFPLKSEYERMNGTIEGVNSIADRDGNPEIGDRYEDDDAERDGEDDDLPKLFDEDDLDDDDDGDGPPHGGGSSSHRGDKDIEHVVHRPIHFDHGSAGDGIVYHNDDGEWVKLDRRGRPYRVDRRDGRKIMRTSRPKDFTPEEWKSLGHEHRKALAEEYKTIVPEGTEHEEVPKESEDDDKKKKKKKKKKDADDKDEGKDDDVPKGPDKPPEDVAVLESVTSKQMVVGAASSGCYGQGDSIPTNTIDENANWVEWEEFVRNMNPAIASVNIGAYYSSSYSSKHSSVASVPSMPCVQHMKDDHRERLGSSFVGDVFRSALVSRPVGRKEMLSDPEALESMMKEWKGQWTADVYDFKTVREYDDVVKEAYKIGEEIHMARVHGICVEKHSELPKEDKRRKFKGRGVLLGNQVKNQNFEAALFQDLGNSPASFESSRWADMYGCLPGHNVQLADAIQAYIQASLTGVACWVELPDEAWPPWIDRKKYRRPVVRLIKALYGHPDAGTMWEKHCDQAVKKLGFVPIGPNWPSMYYYSRLKLLLVVYVDDLKLAGPEGNLVEGWKMLRSLLNIEPETDLGMYLGCTLRKGESRLKDGTRVSTMTYDMESFLEQCIERYKEVAGKDVVLKNVATPSLPEDTKQHPARAPSIQRHIQMSMVFMHIRGPRL